MTTARIDDFLGGDISDLQEIIGFLADVALRLTRDGEVLDVFVRADHPVEVLRDTWRQGDFRQTLTEESRPKFDRTLTAITSQSEAQPIEMEVNHLAGEAFGLPVLYSVRLERDGASVLLLGRDKQEVASAQQRLVAAQVQTEEDGQRSRLVGTTLLAVLDTIAGPVFVLNESTGRIEDRNPEAARLLGLSDDVGHVIFGDIATLENEILTPLSADNGAIPVESVRFRRGSDQMAIVLARRISSEAPRDDDEAFDNATMAIAVTDANGSLVSSNSAFATLVKEGSGKRDVFSGRSVSEFLLRGAVDTQLVLATVDRRGVIAEYDTSLATGQVHIPVALTSFGLGESRASHVVWMFRPGRETPESSVSLLLSSMVGRKPLADILSEATVEIERACIEEALRQTGNNRAAAASILGLSRQSLYVRLRRFGIEIKSSAKL